MGFRFDRDYALDRRSILYEGVPKYGSSRRIVQGATSLVVLLQLSAVC